VIKKCRAANERDRKPNEHRMKLHFMPYSRQVASEISNCKIALKIPISVEVVFFYRLLAYSQNEKSFSQIMF